MGSRRPTNSSGGASRGRKPCCGNRGSGCDGARTSVAIHPPCRLIRTLADAVAVGILEGLDVQLVENGVLVPERVVAHGLPLSAVVHETGSETNPGARAPGWLCAENRVPRGAAGSGPWRG